MVGASMLANTLRNNEEDIICYITYICRNLDVAVTEYNRGWRNNHCYMGYIQVSSKTKTFLTKVSRQDQDFGILVSSKTKTFPPKVSRQEQDLALNSYICIRNVYRVYK